MSYDFLTELHLLEDDELIDKVVYAKNQYSILQKTSWTTKAQILATGFRFTNHTFQETRFRQTSLEKLIKNGRKPNSRDSITGIRGYSGVVTDKDVKLPPTWSSFFNPGLETIASLPAGSCLFQIKLRLNRPFHSKDDLTFYPTDNPLKRDHLFHVPYLGASGIKGLLRWAWRMCNGDDREDDLEAVIFGPRPGDCNENSAQQGCLYSWPLFWDGKIGEDIINPQDREKNAGMVPVRYEVVQAGATATLSFLLLNRYENPQKIVDILEPFLETLHFLLTSSGLSAKRTSDWGNVSVSSWQAAVAGMAPVTPEPEEETVKTKEQLPWNLACDENNELLPIEDERITAKLLSTLTGKSPKYCKPTYRKKAYASLKKKYEQYRQQQAELGKQPEADSMPGPVIRIFDSKNFDAFRKELVGALKQWGNADEM